MTNNLKNFQELTTSPALDLSIRSFRLLNVTSNFACFMLSVGKDVEFANLNVYNSSQSNEYPVATYDINASSGASSYTVCLDGFNAGNYCYSAVQNKNTVSPKTKTTQ